MVLEFFMNQILKIVFFETLIYQTQVLGVIKEFIKIAFLKTVNIKGEALILHSL
ncbi:hypothetical protein D3C80_1651870 [compost metagenome]